MPRIAYDENGNEIGEVLTPEEIKEKDSALAKAAEDLKKANEALEEAKKGGDMSEGQKARLLKEKEEAEKAKGDIEAKYKAEIDALSKKVDSVIGDTRKDALDKLSKGDPELRKKIELEMENIKAKDDSRDSIIEQVSKAATIVTGNRPQPNFMDGIINSADRGDGTGKPVGGEESENSKMMRKEVFKISDADVKSAQAFEEKTYGGKMNIA